MKIFDISRPLCSELAPWPGDTPFRFELKWQMAAGAPVNVGAISMSVHNGTHADAPFHFDQSGASIDCLPLDAYFGPALVVDLTNRFTGADGALKRGREIEIADLERFSDSLQQAPRLLLKTGILKDFGVFPDWIPVIAPGVVNWLRERKVRLLGLDLPSVDTIEAKDLTNHHALAAAHIAIVESLDLREIEGGIYHLSALPLKITGGDAGPVRAVLWRE